MRSPESVLIIDADVPCSHALARVLRRQGARVVCCRTRGQALAAVRKRSFDLAVVDIFATGGGVELARELARHVPRVVLSLGLEGRQEDILEAALGFPVHQKATLSRVL
jgi:ActR/RegA family two-component response regulator